MVFTIISYAAMEKKICPEREALLYSDKEFRV